MTRRYAVAAFCAALAASASLRAQSPPERVAVRGVAFDSLRAAPLADAFVTLDGTRHTVTDARGRFRFDSVAPGRRALAMQHAALDSVGFSGVAATFVVGDGREEITLATPSFATLWRRVCGPTPPPKDSGFVYGTVENAAGAPVVGANVELAWVQIGAVGRRSIVQRNWRGESRSAANGAYGVCGVPTDVPLRIQATTDSASSGMLDLPPEHPRVLRRDLRVAPWAGVEGARRGVITGIVTDSAGAPVPGARVVLEDASEVRTDAEGRFTHRDVATGTRQIEVLALGLAPTTAVADVPADGTVTVNPRLRRLTTLDVVRVTARPDVRYRVEQLEERRRIGQGYVRDSTQIATHGELSSVFAEVPGTYMERERGTASGRFAVSMRGLNGDRCAPSVFVDGAPTDFEHVSGMRPDEIAALEVYPRAFGVPTEFTTARDRSRSCGAVAVWTKFFLRR